jgi:ATP-binding cassette subfamily F protein 3
MTLLAAENISKKFDQQVILNSTSFTLTDSSRIGLVGRNGIGKTTLFNLLASQSEPDEGTITRSRLCRIDYVEQEKLETYERTLMEYVLSARSDLLQMRERMTTLEAELELTPDDSRALDQLGALQQEFDREGGFRFESEVRLILIGLGFDESRHSDRMKNFSGGEKNRAALARLLAGNGTLLLLDEPTNHLDIE